MYDQFIANWLARPKLRPALGYLLAVAPVASRSLLRRHFFTSTFP